LGAARNDESDEIAHETRESRRSTYDLAEIYSWFTEGFDTADLKDAKTLLDELSN
jgi:hypothetical protein